MVDYEVVDNTVRINAMNWAIEPSIEDSEACMAVVIDVLLEVKTAEKVILVEAREREYDYEQVKLLKEIANAYNKILNEDKLISIEKFGPKQFEKLFPQRLSELQFLVTQLLRKDPVWAYIMLQKLIFREKVMIEKAPPHAKICHIEYLEKVLLPMDKILSSCGLIQLAKPNLSKIRPKDRSFYRQVFRPLIRPNFMLTRYVLLPPKDGISIQKYFVGKTSVEIFKVPGKIRNIYHVIPQEFILSEEKYTILDLAKKYLAEHRPSEREFTEPEKTREVFMSIGRDLIRDIARSRGTELSSQEVEELAEILTRYTAGFGVLEVLLSDEKIQDIYINSPIGSTPIFVNHSEFEECETNLLPTKEDAESWATRFRLYSGRPLDEANPVLDTELLVPGGRARVAAITRTLSPYGLAYAFRRHREKPWTFPLFIKLGFFDSLYAGLMSFIIDGGRSLLVAGGRGSGKTSLLGAIMLEVMKKFRICLVEDTLELPAVQLMNLGYNIERLKTRSVITRVEAELPAEEALRTALRLGDSVLIIGEVRSSLKGDQEVLFIKNGCLQRLPISLLEKEKGEILIPTLDMKDFKVKLEKLKDFVKHPKRDKFIKLVTKTGREVIVTPDHSVFTLNSLSISPTEAGKLKVGDKIILPAKLPAGFNDMEYLDLTQWFPEMRLEGVEKYIREAIRKLGWKNASKVVGISDIYVFFRKKKSRIKVKDFLKLMEAAKIQYKTNDLLIKNATSNTLPARFPLTEDFCRFLGYYISEGFISGGKIVISNSDEKVVKKITKLIQKLFGIKPHVRETQGFDKAKQISFNNSLLAKLLRVFGCGTSSSEKRIPPLIFGLSEKKICAFLRGLYTGSGLIVSEKGGNNVSFFTTSKNLANDLMYLLLVLGIVAQVYRKKQRRMGAKDVFIVKFKECSYVKRFLEKVGFDKNVPKIHVKTWSNSKDNELTFKKEELEQHIKKLPRKYRHLKRFGKCSKFYFEKIVDDLDCSQYLRNFVKGEFFVDKIKKVREIRLKKPEYVYDLSVNPTENFIGGFGGILLHNTEAQALFEAMRIGALANLVAGTIHGESAYGVYDRVVNDLRVPSTSFKAIDVITICNLLKTPDGLRRFRRVTELTEVRKHWKQDPLDEGGFVTLMEYSAKEDRLKPTDVLINGESQVLNEIAKRVREWRGNWDAVWDNILLRAKIKQTMVDFARQLNRDDILEANLVVESNETFHMISEEVRQEVGNLDSKMIYEKWLNWFKERIK